MEAKGEAKSEGNQSKSECKQAARSEAKGSTTTLIEVGGATNHIMQKLEDFFCDNPLLTHNIGTFLGPGNINPELFRDLGEEQSLELHEIYLKYSDMIERSLESYLEEQNISMEDFVEGCQQARAAGDLSSFSLDYLMATIEYEDFVSLARDHAMMGQGFFADSFGEQGCGGALEDEALEE
jgi:hypothetical protein